MFETRVWQMFKRGRQFETHRDQGTFHFFLSGFLDAVSATAPFESATSMSRLNSFENRH